MGNANNGWLALHNEKRKMTAFRAGSDSTISQKIAFSLCAFSFLLFVFTSTTTAYAAKKIPCPEGDHISPYLATYKITAIARYGGGLTTETTAKKTIGTGMILSKKLYSVRNFSIENPAYQLKCYQQPEEEGDVPLRSERWSDFYGFGMDRKIIKVLEVYHVKKDPKYPKFFLEIIDNSEIWRMSDGWLYTMKKEK
jgi:hypothetical protein